MRAGLITGQEEIELRELPEPEAGEGRAVVEISYCGICGTDLHAFHSGQPYSPALCGHEWAGTVSAVGPGVLNVREGDRVGIGVAPPCGECSECRSGDAAHCLRVLMQMLGIGPLVPSHGGFAPSIAVDASRLYPVNAKLSDVEAAMLEPATVAVHALRRAPLRLGDSTVVLGAGPIGLLVAQCARAAGAGCVVVVEPDPARAALAARLGATRVIDPGSEDVDAGVKLVCGSTGADVIFECAGIPSTIDQSASLVRRGGCVVLVGFASSTAEIAPGSWLAKEVRLVASLGYLFDEFETTMGLIADGRLEIEPLHTGTVGLSGLSDAFHRLLDPKRGGLEVKTLVDPRLD